MSAPNRRNIQRRISWLASGSSLAAMIIFAAGGVALTPTAALADNECGNPLANGASADTFVCTEASTFSAITYPVTSGNLTLRLQNDVTVTTGGIVITPSDTGEVNITRTATTAGAGDPQIASTTGAGIYITRATGGDTEVDMRDSDEGDAPLSISGTTAGVYLSNAGSGETVLRTSNGTITATDGVGVQMGTSGTGNINLVSGSTISGTTGAVLIAGGLNASVTNNAFGALIGSVTFNNTGNSTLTNHSLWQAPSVVFMGSGTSTLNHGLSVTLNRLAVLAMDGTLTFESLETWNNGGVVLFGHNDDFTGTDGVVGDRIVTGATFNFIRPGLLMMDVLAGGADQTSCAAAVSADCLDLRGSALGGASGTTLFVNLVAGGSGAIADRIVLVDASGGSAIAELIRLDVDSPGYFSDAEGLAGIDGGAFAYSFQFDETLDQYYLVGSFGSMPAQFGHLPEAVRTAWDLTAGTWFDRQIDLRDDGRDSRGGVWLRGVSSYTSNTWVQSAGLFAYDTSYRQNSTALVGGADILVTENLLAGFTAGYTNSEVDHRVGAAVHELEGYSVGAYASWVTDQVFVDGLVNYAKLDTTSTVFSDVIEATSLGVQIEGGYHFPLGGKVFVEPLATLAWVNTEAMEATLTDGSVMSSGDVSSLRAAVGARMAADLELGGLTARFAITGRAWQEFAGETETTVSLSGQSNSLAFDDDRDTLGDIGLGVGVFGIAERLSVNIAGRLRFKEDYESGEFTVGLRYNF